MAVRIGLVLGAGGVVGAAYHAGVLSALADHVGWDARTAEVIVGTSAGSGTGAMLRAGVPAADLAAEVLGTRVSREGARVLARGRAAAAASWERTPLQPARARLALRPQVTAPGILVRAATRPWEARLGLLVTALLPPGTIPTDVISAGMAPHFRMGWPERALWIVAVRLSSGERVVFGREGAPEAAVADAVAASCAIPGFFEPVAVDGGRYVDGGAHSPTNADLAADLGLDLVVVSSPMSRAGSMATGTVSPVRRWARLELDREARRLTRSGTPVLAFQPTRADVGVMGVNAMDMGRRGAVARSAQESARRWLDDPRNASLVALLR
ncbi:MAG TPA: patatin-like phospholipase family protein [Acidimicrobiales bacterium]